MDEISRRAMFDMEVEGLLDAVRSHFRELNEDEGLTPEERQRLKAYYLKHLATPRAKELLQKHFPEDFPSEKSPSPSRATLKVAFFHYSSTWADDRMEESGRSTR